MLVEQGSYRTRMQSQEGIYCNSSVHLNHPFKKKCSLQVGGYFISIMLHQIKLRSLKLIQLKSTQKLNRHGTIMHAISKVLLLDEREVHSYATIFLTPC